MEELDSILAANPLDCGSCTHCCQNHQGIVLAEDLGDDPAHYEGLLDFKAGLAFLKTKPNGDCVFLDRKKGCTAYDLRPTVCRWYDCREDYIKWAAKTRQERRDLIKQGVLNPSVQRQGRKLLQTIFKDGGVSASGD